MDHCVACGARAEGGIVRCPKCGTKLARPGASVQTMGWVTATVSLIPLCFVTIEPGSLASLSLGIAMIFAGAIMIAIGKLQTGTSPAALVSLTMQAAPPGQGTTPAAQAKEATAQRKPDVRRQPR